MSFASIRNPAKDLGRILIAIGFFSIACVGDMFYNPLRKPNKSNVPLTSPPVLSRYHYEITGGPPMACTKELDARLKRASEALATERIWIRPIYAPHQGRRSLVGIRFASQDPSKVGPSSDRQAIEYKLSWLDYIAYGINPSVQSRASR